MTTQPANADSWTGATWPPTTACCSSSTASAGGVLDEEHLHPARHDLHCALGVVTHIAANAEPLSERVIPSGGPCVAVLELNGGTAASIGLKVGDKVRHPFFKP